MSARAQTADYERKYLEYETLPRPVVTDVVFDVRGLIPISAGWRQLGHYHLMRNDRRRSDHRNARPPGRRCARIHPGWTSQAPRWQAMTRNSTTASSASIRPLAPGATTRLDFASTLWRRGLPFRARRPISRQRHLREHTSFAPIIGMDRRGLLQDRNRAAAAGPARRIAHRQAGRYRRAERKLRPRRLGQFAHHHQHPRPTRCRSHRATRCRTRSGDGRRIAVFESPAPILNFFSVQSARYAVAEDRFEDVELAVYHDPRHAWNVPAMLTAMKKKKKKNRPPLPSSLGYFTANFGPYQFRLCADHRIPRLCQLRPRPLPGPCPIPKASALPPTCATRKPSTMFPTSPRMNWDTSTGRIRWWAAICRDRPCCPKPWRNTSALMVMEELLTARIRSAASPQI